MSKPDVLWQVRILSKVFNQEFVYRDHLIIYRAFYEGNLGEPLHPEFWAALHKKSHKNIKHRLIQISCIKHSSRAKSTAIIALDLSITI